MSLEVFYIFNILLTCTITVKIHQASSNLKKHVVGWSGIRGVSFQVRNVVLSSPDRKPWDSKQKTYFLAFSCWDKRMVVYQPFTTKKATIRNNPMVMTSRTARGHEGWGDIPAPTVLIMSPSKLQCTLNCPAFIPHRAFLATAIASIDFDDPEIFFVSSGLVFSSSAKPGVSVSGGYTRDMRMLREISSCWRTSAKPRSANLLAEYAARPYTPTCSQMWVLLRIIYYLSVKHTWAMQIKIDSGGYKSTTLKKTSSTPMHEPLQKCYK